MMRADLDHVVGGLLADRPDDSLDGVGEIGCPVRVGQRVARHAVATIAGSGQRRFGDDLAGVGVDGDRALVVVVDADHHRPVAVRAHRDVRIDVVERLVAARSGQDVTVGVARRRQPWHSAANAASCCGRSPWSTRRRRCGASPVPTRLLGGDRAAAAVGASASGAGVGARAAGVVGRGVGAGDRGRRSSAGGSTLLGELGAPAAARPIGVGRRPRSRPSSSSSSSPPRTGRRPHRGRRRRRRRPRR